MRRFVLAAVCAAFTVPASAQTIGVGGMIGEPIGVTVKVGATRGAQVDVGLDDYFTVQGHFLVRQQRIPGAADNVRFAFGPGAIYRRIETENQIGIGALFGVGWYVDPMFEAFIQVAPQLAVTPTIEGMGTAAFGLRFYPLRSPVRE